MSNNVAVVIVGHNHKRFLHAAISSALSQTTACDVFYVDNASSDGSADHVRKNPRVTVTRNDRNTGYGAANNHAMSRLFAEGYEWCLIMNPDMSLDKNVVRELLATSRAHANTGLVQPVILNADGTEVNTMGNASHYLGFGYCPDTGSPYTPLAQDRSIVSVSGACMLVSRTYFRKVGGFDASFFVYNEDQDLSWRGLMMGYTHFVSAKAVAYHDYDFTRHRSKWYHSQKNRLVMLMKNYALKSMVLFLPVFLVTELCYLAYAVATGKALPTLRAYGYVITHISAILATRNTIQKKRTVPDSRIIPRFDALLRSPLFKNPAVTRYLNPLLSAWYMVVSKI